MGPTTYSTYEAKARFSELLRKVRGGESVFISYRGRTVAELRPIEQRQDLPRLLREQEERGVVVAPKRIGEQPEALRRDPGALRRFLEERD